MARAILTVLIVILLNILVGCGDVDSGKAQLMPARNKASLGSAPVVKISKASEIDIIEQIAINRQAYRQGLELLVENYAKTGNYMKLNWAEKELAALDKMPQYNYIIEAGIAGPGLKAETSIPEADELYDDARRMEKKAGELIIITDETLLRVALDKYNMLIKKHPSSDKIDDAAYQAAGIYEHFRDYSIAVLYYKRAFQWDPETTYPAGFKAAYILDNHLHQRDEALKMYKQAVETVKEDQHQDWKNYAEKRIKELSGSDETSQ